MEFTLDIKQNLTLLAHDKDFRANSIIISNTNRVNMTMAFTIICYKEKLVKTCVKKAINFDRQLLIVDDNAIEEAVKKATAEGKHCFTLTKNFTGIDACEILSELKNAIESDWNIFMKKNYGKCNFKGIVGEIWSEVYKDLSSIEFMDNLEVNPIKASISIFSSIKKEYRFFRKTFLKIKREEYDKLILQHLGRLGEKERMVDDAINNGIKIKIEGFDTLLFNVQHRCRLWAVNKAKQNYDLAIGFSYSNKGSVKLIAASKKSQAIDVFNQIVNKHINNDIGNSLTILSAEDFHYLFFKKASK